MKKLYNKIIFGCILIICNVFLWFYFDVGSLLTVESIKRNREFLLHYVEHHYAKSAALYMLLYALDATLFLPATSLIIMLGGLLFGIIGGTCYAMIGATCGGTGAFLIARHLFGKALQMRYHTQLENFNHQMQNHGARYLLFIRLIPLFPFFLTNALAGLTLIPAKTFIWTTAVGVIPSIVIYTCLGQQLATINTFHDIFTTRFFIALGVLGLLSLVPLIVKPKK